MLPPPPPFPLPFDMARRRTVLRGPVAQVCAETGLVPTPGGTLERSDQFLGILDSYRGEVNEKTRIRERSEQFLGVLDILSR